MSAFPNYTTEQAAAMMPQVGELAGEFAKSMEQAESMADFMGFPDHELVVALLCQMIREKFAADPRDFIPALVCLGAFLERRRRVANYVEQWDALEEAAGHQPRIFHEASGYLCRCSCGWKSQPTKDDDDQPHLDAWSEHIRSLGERKPNETMKRLAKEELP